MPKRTWCGTQSGSRSPGPHTAKPPGTPHHGQKHRSDGHVRHYRIFGVKIDSPPHALQGRLLVVGLDGDWGPSGGSELHYVAAVDRWQTAALEMSKEQPLYKYMFVPLDGNPVIEVGKDREVNLAVGSPYYYESPIAWPEDAMRRTSCELPACHPPCEIPAQAHQAARRGEQSDLDSIRQDNYHHFRRVEYWCQHHTPKIVDQKVADAKEELRRELHQDVGNISIQWAEKVQAGETMAVDLVKKESLDLKNWLGGELRRREESAKQAMDNMSEDIRHSTMNHVAEIDAWKGHVQKELFADLRTKTTMHQQTLKCAVSSEVLGIMESKFAKLEKEQQGNINDYQRHHEIRLKGEMSRQVKQMSNDTYEESRKEIHAHLAESDSLLQKRVDGAMQDFRKRSDENAEESAERMKQDVSKSLSELHVQLTSKLQEETSTVKQELESWQRSTRGSLDEHLAQQLNELMTIAKEDLRQTVQEHHRTLRDELKSELRSEIVKQVQHEIFGEGSIIVTHEDLEKACLVPRKDFDDLETRVQGSISLSADQSTQTLMKAMEELRAESAKTVNECQKEFGTRLVGVQAEWKGLLAVESTSIKSEVSGAKDLQSKLGAACHAFRVDLTAAQEELRGTLSAQCEALRSEQKQLHDDLTSRLTELTDLKSKVSDAKTMCANLERELQALRYDLEDLRPMHSAEEGGEQTDEENSLGIQSEQEDWHQADLPSSPTHRDESLSAYLKADCKEVRDKTATSSLVEQGQIGSGGRASVEGQRA